jgi:aldehyde oxidoreductase
VQLRKMWLNINGADRMLVCDPEQDSLSDVLRRMGLTGTKVGCDEGICGSCTIILDAKIVRPCLRKMRTVPEYSRITTIEGIGTPTNLHPIQVALMNAGAVHCGFCTPGFVVATKTLLDQISDPDDRELRHALDGNLCRCTGYVKQLAAIRKAAAKLRVGKAG